MFDIGDSIINTKTHHSGTVIAFLPAGPRCLRDIYIIDDGDRDNYVIVDAEYIVAYDKYYWDELEASTNG